MRGNRVLSSTGYKLRTRTVHGYDAAQRGMGRRQCFQRRSQAWRGQYIIRDCMLGCKVSNSSLDVFKIASVDVARQQNTTAQFKVDSTNDKVSQLHIFEINGVQIVIMKSDIDLKFGSTCC